MPTIRTPKAQVKLLPREGELEITLNINISVDGNITASSDEAEVKILSTKEKEREEKAAEPMIPDFDSSGKLSGFGLWGKKKKD